MSEQEKKSGANVAGGSSVVVVEQSGGSRHKQPYRPTELQEEAPDLHHKRSRAPAVPSVAEELKNLPEENITSENVGAKDRKGDERKIPPSHSSDKHKHNVSKKLSSNTKRRDMSPETITLAPLEIETLKQSSKVSSQQPIPAHVGSLATPSEKIPAEKRSDDDSISEEIAELRTPDTEKKHDWSDVEEAGGLPRSESRASRVSRAMRQLLCCGVRYETPSEDNISNRGFASGI